VAAERLLSLVESKHTGCIEAAQAARMAATAQSSGAGASTEIRQKPSVDAFQVMMRLQAAKQAAAEANALL